MATTQPISLIRIKSARQDILRALIVLGLTVAVLAALVVSVMATMESMRFGRGLDQIFMVVGSAQSYAKAQSSFATRYGENMLETMDRAGLVRAIMDERGVRIINPWGGAVHAVITAPSIMRVDSDVFAYTCRRLVRAFADEAAAFSIQKIEVWNNRAWRTLFTDSQPDASLDAVEAGCGTDERVIIGLSFRLR